MDMFIERVDTIKDLGVTVTSDLNLSTYIDNTLSEATKFMGKHFRNLGD